MSVFPRRRTRKLYDLIKDEKWGEVLRRCRDHPQDARWKDWAANLPIHRACRWGAPLSEIRQLHEAYGDGIKTSNGGGSLPIHLACRNGASLEVIIYLNDLHPHGATQKDKDGKIPVDLLKDNNKLSEEDKTVAIAILSEEKVGARTTPSRSTKSTANGTLRRASMKSANTSISTVSTPSAATYAATTTTSTSGRSTDHYHDTPSSPTTSTWPYLSPGVAIVEGKGGSGVGKSDVQKGALRLHVPKSGDVLPPPGDVSGSDPERPPTDLQQRRPNQTPADTSAGGVRTHPDCGDVDDYREATEAVDAAVAAHARARGDAASLAAKAAAAGNESEEARAAAEELDAAEAEAASAKAEAGAAVRSAQLALEEASRMHATAKEAADRGRGRAAAAEQSATQLRKEAEAARANVQRTFVAAKNALARKQELRYRVFAPDRDRLKPFLESTGHSAPAAVGLSLGYVKACTHDFSDEHRLGEGAFGVVYRGYDDVLQRRFAVKRIKYEIRMVTDDDGIRATRKLLENELTVLNEFQHAHIARLYGYILTENLQDEQILIYELASRGSLHSFFESEAKRSELPWQRRVLIALQVASAIRFLHEGGGGGNEEYFCYHRDVKSANVCLRADYSAVLIDCGLAKMIPKKDSRGHGWTATTRSGGQPGTIEYMCPLYATGLPVSDRTDVFAFGIVLLELFTGRLQKNRPDGFYDRYISDACDGPGDKSLIGSDVDEAAGMWKTDARNGYSSLALECIRTKPNNRPTMREVFRRLSDIAQMHCFLEPEEVDEIQRGQQASSYECVIEIAEEILAKQEETNVKLGSIGTGVRGVSAKVDSVLQRLQWMTAALTSVVREESCPCPRLAILVPSASCDKISLRSPSGWLSKDVHLYFLCACDLTPVQNPVVLTVNREWLEKAVPFLKIAIFVLRAASAAGRACTGLPFDVLPCIAGKALQLLDTGYQSISGSAWQEELESYCESLVGAGESDSSEEAVARGKVLTDEAYEVVSEKACEENNKSWAHEMELVASGRDGLVWIKRENNARWIEQLDNS